MKKFCFLIAAALLPVISLYAQHEHGEHEGHHHGRNEIGVSTGAIYAFDHKEWGTGVHIHYFRTLSDHSKWAVGAVAEIAWADGPHTTLGAGMKYQITERLSAGVMPGVTFMGKGGHDHDGHNDGHEGGKAKFSAHLELVYDLFHWDNFHLGPVVDYSWGKDDSHGMVGVHAAFCF